MTFNAVEIPATDSVGLLEQAQQGDAAAFCELCRIHELRLVRQAMTLCGDATLAEDLAQDTLVEAWKCIRRYNGRCQFFTWLCAILLNRFRNVLRERRPVAFSSLNRGDQDGLESALGTLVDGTHLPDESAMLAERAMLLQESLSKLPEKQREVIYLRFYVDQSLEGVAAALGCSVGTVKSRLFNALEKLRAMNCLSREVGELQPFRGQI